MERGTVSSRVALLLRSAEVKPLLRRFVQQNVELFLLFLIEGSLKGRSFDFAVSVAWELHHDDLVFSSPADRPC
jgi:hypothetical protein